MENGKSTTNNPSRVPAHTIQRGNNRQACFDCDEDFGMYITLLKEYAPKYLVNIHAWLLMTNHVHMLCTTDKQGGISQMMQSVGRRYVQYFNFSYKRSGTLWEGRFRFCLVQEKEYLLQVYRYIELNPVRAGIVGDPGGYKWSSHQINGFGRPSDLCTPHYEYQALGADHSKRQQAYRQLFNNAIEGAILKEIRENTHKGMAVSDSRQK